LDILLEEEPLHTMNKLTSRIGTALGQLLHWLNRPLARWLEILLWIGLVGLIIWPRLHLIQLLNGYLLSADAGSYYDAVLRWLDTGVWESDPRRGPVYSLLIALVLKIFGNFTALMTVQHGLGGLSVFLGIVLLRILHGARAWLPLAACGFAYAVYGAPITMEHTVRNETLLFLFATIALGSWFMAIHKNNARWLVVTGLAAGLLWLTKNILPPLPLIVIASLFWVHRPDWKKGMVGTLYFCAALGLVLIGGKIERMAGPSPRPPEPQSGLLFYARVAQFTKTEGGIEPEIKALIRDDIEAYRAFIREKGKLDNNIVLKRSAIPRLRSHLIQQGKTPSELNSLCRRFAIEAVLAHPREYFSQMAKDFVRLNLNTGWNIRGELHDSVADTIEQLQRPIHPIFRAASNIQSIEHASDKKKFLPYRRILDRAWLFNFQSVFLRPVLLTTLLLPIFVWLTKKPEHRCFWAGSTVLWYFTLVLLCTVGKPMHRYMLPVTPIMFWTLSSAIIIPWQWMVRVILGLRSS
jgi:hypothetical protein